MVQMEMALKPLGEHSGEMLPLQQAPENQLSPATQQPRALQTVCTYS